MLSRIILAEPPHDRTFTHHGYAVTLPLLRPVIPHRMMEHASIIPDGDGVFGPAESTLEIHSLAVPKQKFEQGSAFFFWQIVDRLRKLSIDK